MTRRLCARVLGQIRRRVHASETNENCSSRTWPSRSGDTGQRPEPMPGHKDSLVQAVTPNSAPRLNRADL
jgi:hypothetical protein